ncbi:PDR/VanB family oxidoreductase [Roseateles koreensis]|uniref:PDR/VanB family oxidoreductase n=1 Tax=Roseateles koreensis TaxID=2987526 RepID=A0ABT5KP14_9BURK|nr:PDR/VanB family oxidoreductase [Roseateles koreensis]MDC8784665.1 PDR/VanB family oxidoreductase [Roseateles koreensis]
MSGSLLRVRVAEKRQEAVDICSFELVAADGSQLPAFTAGAHVDVHIGNGITRQYSLCNDPADAGRYQICVLNDAASRGGSRRMHEAVGVGDALQISVPKNHFPLAVGAGKSLLLAGGIGITPILCMAQHLARVGAAFEMHYCTRTHARTAFAGRIAASPFAAQVHHHFSEDDGAARLNLQALLSAPDPTTHLYVCGPKGFMDAVLEAARVAGWPEAQLHCEFFAADLGARDDDGSFEVELARSGQVVVVGKDQSVVQALAAIGVEVPTSCEQGVCGTCLTRVLAGTPDHRDLYQTPQEQACNDQFMPCCSRSRSARLVLDL